MNETVKETLEGSLAHLDDNIVWKSEEVYDRKVGYEVATSELAELREKRFQIEEFLAAQPEPRVWDRLSAVGKSLKVRDSTGRVWSVRDSNEWGYSAGGRWISIGYMKSWDYDHHGPFTEIV